MLLNYGYVYSRDFEPVFSKMLRTCGMYFSFELTLVFKHVQVYAGDTNDGFLFYSFYLYLTLFLSSHFVFQHVTLIDHPFLICWIFLVGGGVFLQNVLL